MESKKCPICEKTLPFSEFPKMKYKDTFRYHTYCKICKRVKGREHYQNNKLKYKQNYNNFKEKNPDYMPKYLKEYMPKYYQNNENLQRNYQLMNKLKSCLISRNNDMKDIIGLNIDDFNRWLDFTKEFYCKNEEKLCIEHLISSSKFNLSNEKDVKKYLNYTNIRLFPSNENNRKRDKLFRDDELRQKYLAYCFRNQLKPTIEYVNLY